MGKLDVSMIFNQTISYEDRINIFFTYQQQDFKTVMFLYHNN